VADRNPGGQAFASRAADAVAVKRPDFGQTGTLQPCIFLHRESFSSKATHTLTFAHQTSGESYMRPPWREKCGRKSLPSRQSGAARNREVDLDQMKFMRVQGPTRGAVRDSEQLACALEIRTMAIVSIPPRTMSLRFSRTDLAFALCFCFVACPARAQQAQQGVAHGAANWWFSIAVLALGIALVFSLRSARLLAHRVRLDAIVQSAMDAIITVDEQQRIVLFNAAAEQMFRCSKANAVGRPLDVFIPQRFRGAHHKHVEQFARTGSTARGSGRSRRTRPTGFARWVAPSSRRDRARRPRWWPA